MLDVKRLRILREVAQQGSFSAAGDALYLSQSAVSQQIATLEREVGMQLLDRTREGPKLTDAGRVLVSHAEAAIARLDEAEREVAGTARRHLQIGVGGVVHGDGVTPHAGTLTVFEVPANNPPTHTTTDD